MQQNKHLPKGKKESEKRQTLKETSRFCTKTYDLQSKTNFEIS